MRRRTRSRSPRPGWLDRAPGTARGAPCRRPRCRPHQPRRRPGVEQPLRTPPSARARRSPGARQRPPRSPGSLQAGRSPRASPAPGGPRAPWTSPPGMLFAAGLDGEAIQLEPTIQFSMQPRALACAPPDQPMTSRDDHANRVTTAHPGRPQSVRPCSPSTDGVRTERLFILNTAVASGLLCRVVLQELPHLNSSVREASLSWT